MNRPGVTTRRNKQSNTSTPAPSTATRSSKKKTLENAPPEPSYDVTFQKSFESSVLTPMETDEIPDSSSEESSSPIRPKEEYIDKTEKETSKEVPKPITDSVPYTGVLPFSNPQEKIILVVDRAEDEAYTHFKIEGNSLPPLDMLKRAVEHFLQLKHSIDKKHQFALVFLNENSCTWELDFTSDHKKVVNALNQVEACEAEDIFDLKTLFNVIEEHVVVPSELKTNGVLISPANIVRTVLFYSRSYTIPQLDMSEATKSLLDSPFFILDVLMTHEAEDINNNCGKILEVLQKIDRKGLAYFFSVERSTKLMCHSTGKLLSHPLQRPIQKEANYKLEK